MDIHLVACKRNNVLKYGSSSRTQASKLSANVLFDVQFILSSKPSSLAVSNKGRNIFSLGSGCLLNNAKDGKLSEILSATAIFAKSIISSTILFVSRDMYIPTSNGLLVSSSNSNLTSGEANVKAPCSILFTLSAFDTSRKRLKSLAKSLLSFSSSSIISCAF